MFSKTEVATILDHYPCVSHYVVAYSGGLDSHVLLHMMAGLSAAKKLHVSALHINHHISPLADSWQKHCETVCEALSIPLETKHVAFNDASKESLETAARHARYAIFENYLADNAALLLAHHANDQAETVLFRLLRGAGIAGLAGMPNERPIGKGILLRPLLNFSREALLAYAKVQDLKWIEDDSNQSLDHSRNFLRHAIFPRLKERWPAVVEQINRAAYLCHESEMIIDERAQEDFSKIQTEDSRIITLQFLFSLPRARQANVLRFWIKKMGLSALAKLQLDEIIDQVIGATDDAAPKFVIKHWGEIRRYQHKLYYLPNVAMLESVPTISWNISVPFESKFFGTLSLKMELGRGMRVQEDDHVEIRSRQGGERCQLVGDAHTRPLKYWLQHWHIPPWLRARLPLIYVNGRLAAIADFGVCQEFAAKPNEMGYVIRWKKPF